MWIARDENGNLNLFRFKPYRSGISSIYWIADIEKPDNYKMRIDRDLFPDLKHYNNPMKVELCPAGISSDNFEKEVFEEVIETNKDNIC